MPAANAPRAGLESSAPGATPPSSSRPINSDFAPLVLAAADAERVRVVAEFVEVVHPPALRSGRLCGDVRTSADRRPKIHSNGTT